MAIQKDFDLFTEKLKKKTGIDLSLYKREQMERRLTSFRDKKGFNNFEKFFDAMLKDEDLFNEMLDRMTINVTQFYRNPERWEILQNKILPQLLKEKGKLKILSAACSTGEEPYTLALILKDLTSTHNFDITAIDIDKNVLNKAKQGVYNSQSVSEVPKDKITKYFSKEGISYKISNEIKSLVTFKQHNLLLDKLDTNYDLIVCRNVMIYFTDEAKELLYKKFSNSLKKDGVFFVGSTEQIINPKSYDFYSEDTFFYKKL